MRTRKSDRKPVTICEHLHLPSWAFKAHLEEQRKAGRRPMLDLGCEGGGCFRLIGPEDDIKSEGRKAFEPLRDALNGAPSAQGV